MSIQISSTEGLSKRVDEQSHAIKRLQQEIAKLDQRAEYVAKIIKNACDCLEAGMSQDGVIEELRSIAVKLTSDC